MKKRQLKKVFKIVAKQINSGDLTKLKPVYFRIIDKTLANFVERKYINEFRSWWYDQDWSKFDLTTEILRYHKQWDKEFEEWSGINMDLYTQYFQKNHKKSA